MGAIERLVIELGQLHHAAGSPSLRQVINAVKRQAPDTRLGVATLQNWLKGTTVPSDPRTFALVIGVLEASASRRHRIGGPASSSPQAGYQPRGAPFWEALRKACADERRAARPSAPHRATATPESSRKATLESDRPSASAQPGRSAPTPPLAAPVPAPPVPVAHNDTAPAAAPRTRSSRRRIWLSAAVPLDE